MSGKSLVHTIFMVFLVCLHQSVLALDAEYIDQSGDRVPFSSPVRVGLYFIF